MPITQLDPVAALIVVDLQKGIVAASLAHPAGDIVARAARLARAFRERKLPVALVHVTAAAPGRTDTPAGLALAPGFADLLPELEQAPSDIIVTKQRRGAFIGTPLDDELRRRGATQVFIAGIATSAGVESTARSAHDLGYNVVLVTDAMTDRDADTHRFCVETIFPRIGETGTTDAALALLGAGATAG